MAIKFPLEMKDGVMARNINELKENFDTEKILGYFLDGKLKNWLDARYYEEESEAVEQLDGSDPEIAKKLCEIFGVEYEEKAVIDTEEIARKNERIAKLKQFTDDEGIINNIDLVAFNQEELAELYDEGVEKIYLCEGDFNIPKSKQELEYVVVANAKVMGLRKSEEIIDKERQLGNENFYHIPIELADKINLSAFCETKDYVVYSDEFSFYKYDKNTNQEANISVPERYRPFHVGDSFYWAFDNTIVFEAHPNSNPGKLLLCNLENNFHEEVDLHVCHGWGTKKCVIENLLVYSKDGHIQTFNLKTKESVFCLESHEDSRFEDYIVFCNKLLYSGSGNLRIIEMDNYGKCIQVVERDESEFNSPYGIFVPYNKDMFWIQYQSSLAKDKKRQGLKVNKVNINDNSCICIVDLAGENITFDDNYGNPNFSKYIPFIKRDENFSVYVFIMETGEVKKIATNCGYGGIAFNEHQIVGDYLFYKVGRGRDICRVDILTGTSQIIKI